MSAQPESSSHQISDVPEVPESTNLVAMALNDSTPDLVSPNEIAILTDENANGNVEVDDGSASQQKGVIPEGFLESDGALDFLCDRLKDLNRKVLTNESPSSSFEDLSGMPDKKPKNENVLRALPRLINPMNTDEVLIPCSKCNRKYFPGPLKDHEKTCDGISEVHEKL